MVLLFLKWRSKPIFTSLSPNTEKDDILLVWKLLFQSWRWTPPTRHPISINQLNQHKSAVEQLEEEFKKYLGVKYAFAFNSGRSAFLAILKSLDLKDSDEFLLQAFTCNAAINPILWSGLKPVFVDIEKETLNLDPEDLKKTLRQAQGKKPKVLMVQHTFGLPANLDEISEICQKNNLILIEDCAHSLGATYQGKKVGSFGKAGFFSFGRDKIISSVYGGMAVTNDHILAEKIKKFQEECPFPSHFWISQQLLHPILTNYLIMPLYGFWGLGRWLLLFFQKVKILSKAVHKLEKRGKKPSYFPQKMPQALAILAQNQFRKLERFNSHRQKIATFYEHKLEDLGFCLPFKTFERIYMRYPVLVEDGDTDKILKEARRQKIFLDDGWRKMPIMPPDTDQRVTEYILGSCPVAEKAAQTIINLPTHINISLKDSQRITNFLKENLR